LAHLKSYLRPAYKKAVKEIRQDAKLAALQQSEVLPAPVLANR
jgi:hypothetical protein